MVSLILFIVHVMAGSVERSVNQNNHPVVADLLEHGAVQPFDFLAGVVDRVSEACPRRVTRARELDVGRRDLPGSRIRKLVLDEAEDAISSADDVPVFIEPDCFRRQMLFKIGDVLGIVSVDAGLNEVGARIWALLEAPKTVKEIRDALVTEYHIEPERCECEVLALLRELAEEGLIEVSDDPAQ